MSGSGGFEKKAFGFSLPPKLALFKSLRHSIFSGFQYKICLVLYLWLPGQGAIKILLSHSATLAASVFARTNRIPGKN